MNFLESIDEYIKQRWKDIIELMEIENDINIEIIYPEDRNKYLSGYIREPIFLDSGERIADIYIYSEKAFKLEKIKKIMNKLKEIIIKDIKLSDTMKTAEKNLNFSEKNKMFQKLEFLSLLPETNPNIVLIVECDGEIVYSNKSTMKWLKENGFENQEEIKVLYPKQFNDRFCSVCGSFKLKSEKVEYKDQVFDFKIKPIKYNRKCMIILTDITEIENLSKEKELYYKAFQSSIHGMLITDTKGYINYVNPKFLELYGYNYDEVIGKGPNILNPGIDKYYDLGYPKQKYHDLFTELWESISDPKIGYWEGTIPNQKKNGDLIWVNLIISAIHDSDGNITNYLGIPVDITEKREEDLKIRLDIYKTITEVAEIRDNETGEHITRVGKYAKLMAEKLGMPKKFCQDIEMFAPLHDIGKVGINDSILLAPRRLTKEEFEIMKTHTSLGYEILKEKPTMEMAADIAHHHHEHYDGSGYPLNLKGNNIPLCARIVSIADVYDALRSKRPYKEPWGHLKAINQIEDEANSHFDPELVKIFLENEKEMKNIADKYKD
ncbi:MAG: HD domain-containing phosphohydrolase [Thermotogota bacterium]